MVDLVVDYYQTCPDCSKVARKAAEQEAADKALKEVQRLARQGKLVHTFVELSKQGLVTKRLSGLAPCGNCRPAAKQRCADCHSKAESETQPAVAKARGEAEALSKQGSLADRVQTLLAGSLMPALLEARIRALPGCIIDESSGDNVCTGCGLVVAERCFDAGTEWRNFKTDGVGSGQDVHARARADRESAYNPLTEDFKAGTDVYGGGAVAQSLAKAIRMVDATHDQNLEQTDERIIQDYTKKARAIARRMDLGDNVVQRCVGLLQRLAERGQLSKQRAGPWFCALVHLGSFEEQCTQRVSEIAKAVAPRKKLGELQVPGLNRPVRKDALAPNSAADKLEEKINREVRDLRRALGIAQEAPLGEDRETVARTCRSLNLAPQVGTFALQIVEKAYKQAGQLQLKIGRMRPSELTAAAIFIVVVLLGVEQRPSLHKVAAYAHTTEARVKAAYGALYPVVRYLLPEGFKIGLVQGVQGLPEPRRLQ